MLKDVFVQACGWGVFPGVGFMVMGCGCLCRTVVMESARLGTGAPASRGCYCCWLGQTLEMYSCGTGDRLAAVNEPRPNYKGFFLFCFCRGTKPSTVCCFSPALTLGRQQKLCACPHKFLVYSFYMSKSISHFSCPRQQFLQTFIKQCYLAK